MFKERKSLTEKLKESIHPTPLRKKISLTLSSLKIQLKRLENATYRLEQRDKILYGKCVSALQRGDKYLASLYANECAEIRKIAKITLTSQLALEKVTLKLETIRDFGDIAYSMNSVTCIIGTLRNGLKNLMPDISIKLDEVNEDLQNLVMEMGESTDHHLDLETVSEDSRKIIEEASIVAEQKMKEKFPELPIIATKETKI
ncbi:MAG: Snf7 family protein [Candidatus Bathyarchaeia archaeon]